MAGRERFNGRRSRIALPLQDIEVRKTFSGFTTKLKPGVAVWEGTLTPRENSPRYRVRIVYKLTDIPRVWVLWPELPPGTPHVWPEDGRLCLYWFKEMPWHPNYLIARTIIPWTALWLYYFELWLDTGKFLGPSSHDAAPRLPYRNVA